MSPVYRLLPLVVFLGACGDFNRGVNTKTANPTSTTNTTGTNTTETVVTTWSSEVEYTLGIDDTVPQQLDLVLSKEEVADLLGPVADDVLLMELDSGPMLTSALTEIKNACGTSWQLPNSNPNHNCNQTALGQRFWGPADGTWRSSPEYAMVRILTMTPANSEVAGTSMSALQGIADFLSIGGGFGQILADSLSLGLTEEFLTTQYVRRSLQRNLLQTHPAMNGSDAIPVSLADALADMATLSSTFGPSGNHPGILDPNIPANSQILTDDFRMNISMRSNLRVLDGLDLSTDKDYLVTVVDQTGPTFQDPAEFDFNDPTMFSMSGIATNPRVDLSLKMFEHNGFVPACTGNGCKSNYPSSPVGAGTVWTLNPWDVEYIIADAGYERWGSFVNQESYYLLFFIWVADVDIGITGPPGWADFSVLLDLGAPPPSQFVWELVNEVAQVNLHDNGYYSFPEGQADVSFTLHDIDIGITAREIEDAVRPYLQDQSGELADYLLGDYRKNSGPVDFFYRRASNGVPALYFVHADDREAGLSYDWQNPGFFSDEAMTQKVSNTTVGDMADQVHEKWVPPVGESIVFVEDDDGQRYRMRVFVAGEDQRSEISVLVSGGTQ